MTRSQCRNMGEVTAVIFFSLFALMAPLFAQPSDPGPEVRCAVDYLRQLLTNVPHSRIATGR